MADNPYANLSDIEVFNRARDALITRDKLPAGDITGRGFWQEVFDSAMLELGWRAIMRAAAQLEAAE